MIFKPGTPGFLKLLLSTKLMCVCVCVRVCVRACVCGQAISAEAEEDLKDMDLLPRMHIMADRNKEKASTQRTHDKVLLYVQLCLLAKRSASRQ